MSPLNTFFELGSEHPAVVIARRPKAGLEEAFAAWAQGIYQVMAEQPGFQSYQAVPPLQGESRDWYFVFTFDTPENLRRWLGSDTRAHWQALSLPLTEGPGHARVASGLESLFGIPSPEESDPPAVWKLALATELGLAPTVFAVGLVLMNLGFYAAWSQGGPWGVWWQVLLSTSLCVSLMTWVVMPLLTRLLGRWLYPRKAERTP
ncbi:MAG: hypothetical protein IPN59_09835 [Holophaga sp.]|nr:hypothetical protein [Holophaga sp.]